MKSFKDKTMDLLEEMIYIDFRTEIGIDKARTLIRRALKEQDRDTRHACADNIVTTANGDELTIHEACHACLNTKAG